MDFSSGFGEIQEVLDGNEGPGWSWSFIFCGPNWFFMVLKFVICPVVSVWSWSSRGSEGPADCGAPFWLLKFMFVTGFLNVLTGPGYSYGLF